MDPDDAADLLGELPDVVGLGAAAQMLQAPAQACGVPDRQLVETSAQLADGRIGHSGQSSGRPKRVRLVSWRRKLRQRT